MMPKESSRTTTATILDEYCRYYSDFSKILGIYIKNFYPNLHFQLEQLLDASYNIWHRLSDADKISLATFLEEISRENTQDLSKLFHDLINSEFMIHQLKSPKISNRKVMPVNTSSSPTPYHIYLKDERQKWIRKHATMSMREINKRLSERWQRMSNRMKGKYEYRSYLAKKRLHQK